MNLKALFFALVMAAAGAALLILHVSRVESELSGGPRVAILTVLNRVERGKAITDDVIGVREVPLAYVEDRAVRATDRNRIVNLSLVTTLQAQQSIMWTDLDIGTRERRDLSSLVQAGNRAMSIKLPQDSSVNLIQPGDYVDILAEVTGANDARTSIVLLQRVLVLAVGEQTSADARPEKTTTAMSPVISLSVNVREAQLLNLAAAKGRLSAALRNPEDTRTIENISDVSGATLTQSDVRTAAVRPTKNVPIDINANRRQ